MEPCGASSIASDLRVVPSQHPARGATRSPPKALQAKFAQHAELGAALLATGDATLVEHTTNNAYWADGGDGHGRNRLGILLMRLRDALRSGLA